MMVGARRADGSDRIVLDAQAIYKKYGDVVALNFVSMSIRRGEKIVILGRNGAGKSTLLRIMAGIEQPDFGRVSFMGTHMGYVPDYVPRFPGIRIIELARLFASERGISFNKIMEILEKFGIVNLERKIDHLSKGFKRRLMLALAIAVGSDLLLLDEPFNGIDPEGRQLLHSVLDELKTYVLTTHVLSEIPKGATTLYFMSEGKILDSARKGEPVWISKRRVNGERVHQLDYLYLVFGGEGDERIF